MHSGLLKTGSFPGSMWYGLNRKCISGEDIERSPRPLSWVLLSLKTVISHELMSTQSPPNFIRDIIIAEIESGKYEGRVQTRSPEPNGYLPLGYYCVDRDSAELGLKSKPSAYLHRPGRLQLRRVESEPGRSLNDRGPFGEFARVRRSQRRNNVRGGCL